MTTFLLRAYCPDCMSVLVPVTSAPMPSFEPEAEANCPTCNGFFLVSACVERVHSIGRLGPVDRQSVINRGADASTLTGGEAGANLGRV